jgi:hypothetical protein
LGIFFSSNISKTPKFILNKETENRKNERKRSIEKKRKEEKLQKSLFWKKGNSIFWEEKTFSKLFHVSPFSPPPFYHFKNPFPNHLKILGTFRTIP